MAGVFDAERLLSARPIIRDAFRVAVTGLVLTGCLTAHDPGYEGSMTRADAAEAANAWYGMLLNAGTAGHRTMDGSRRGKAAQALEKEAEHWRRWRRAVARASRKSANPRRDFYAGIETMLPMEKPLSSRSRLQALLVETSSPEDRAIVECYTLAAEHAVLTERAVRLGNGVAVGDIKAQAFLAEARNLKMFRSECRPILSKKLPLLENQERQTYDVTGLDLLQVTGDDHVLVDFFDMPQILTRMAADGGESAPKNDPWETIPRRIFPAAALESDNMARTTFRLSAPGVGNITEKSSLRLIVWAAAGSFSVALNDRSLGVIDAPKEGRTVSLPVDKADLTSLKETLMLTVSMPGKQVSLPFRAVFLTGAD
ncbi:MAG: hypothetical protein RRC34_01995 [Lentisphaeria bacterium]|nr:hypothetical protein [Lentisphaeria bacterium]